MSNDIKYVQFEPAAFLADTDFIRMTAEERGVYFTILICQYCNNGRVENDVLSLSKVCNVNDEFDFQPVLKKFQVKRGYLYHKRVQKEIKKAQAKHLAGVKAAQTRWNDEEKGYAVALPPHSDGNANQNQPKPNQMNMVGKTNTNTKGITNIIPPTPNSESVGGKNSSDLSGLVVGGSGDELTQARDILQLCKVSQRQATKLLATCDAKIIIKAFNEIKESNTAVKNIAGYLVGTIRRLCGKGRR